MVGGKVYQEQQRRTGDMVCPDITPQHQGLLLVIGGIIFVALMSFFVAVVCGYMAGLIGSSNSPLSGVGILVVIGAAVPLAMFIQPSLPHGAAPALVAYALLVTAVVFAAATISNDNLQDLKTGQLVDATPWRQQVALMIGVLAGAVVIPPILDLLNHAFGFAGAPGVNSTRALAAPPEAGARARSDLALSLLLVGDMLSQTGDAAGAATILAEGLAIAETLVAAAPASPQHRRIAYFLALDLGDAQLANVDYADALAAYVAARDRAAATLAADTNDVEAAGRLKTSVGKIGLLANAMLVTRDFSGALATLDQATPATPEQNWLDLVRAAALMFLGRSEEARALYDKHRGETTYSGKTWEAATRETFANLRAKGLASPLMDEVAASFAPN